MCASQVAQWLRMWLPVQETRVWSLGQEDPLGNGGEGYGPLLQYSCLENSMDRGAWQTIVSPWDCKRVRHSSVQFSHSVMSDSLRPHEPQHARPPCPTPPPRVHPNPCPLCRWCHLTVSSSVIPFSCPSVSPSIRSFQMSQQSASGGQSIGVSASTSVPPMNTQDWSPLGWTGWIFLQSKGLSRVFY